MKKLTKNTVVNGYKLKNITIVPALSNANCTSINGEKCIFNCDTFIPPSSKDANKLLTGNSDGCYEGNGYVFVPKTKFTNKFKQFIKRLWRH